MTINNNMIPNEILDLHTHLFNARYLPLGRIIADRMGKDESKLADLVAALLWQVTGSTSRLITEETTTEQLAAKDTESYIDLIWGVTEFELVALAPTELPKNKNFTQKDWRATAVIESTLATIIDALDEIVYADEGVGSEELTLIDGTLLTKQKFATNSMSLKFNLWEKSVKRALRALSKLCKNIEGGGDFIEFLWTMLHSEETLLKKLTNSYGKYKTKMRFVHYMMDMEKAYKQPAEVYYPFFPRQLEEMANLKRSHTGKIVGFSAFDPRRKNWKDIADASLASGFSGFKFYPAMGYLPFGDKQPYVQDRINDFFQYCIERNKPIFVHCTPIGFETKEHYGLNTHPKHWASVLQAFPELRLCFGHAGGGKAERKSASGKKTYYGWAAQTKAQWDDPDNFARIVASLCTQYKNVYCEVAYITELLEGEKWITYFIANLEKARDKNSTYDLMHKMAYGSDWDMPSMVDNTLAYLEIFLDIFNRPEYAPYRERFFSETAYEFLGR